jgi:hypothetical protein
MAPAMQGLAVLGFDSFKTVPPNAGAGSIMYYTGIYPYLQMRARRGNSSEGHESSSFPQRIRTQSPAPRGAGAWAVTFLELEVGVKVADTAQRLET